MKKYFSKQFIQTLSGLSLALVFGLGVNFVFAEWQGPTANPTGNNPSNILTTGGDQVKTGKLSVFTTDSIATNRSFQVGDNDDAYTNGVNLQKFIVFNRKLAVYDNSGLYGDVIVGPKQTIDQPSVKLTVDGRTAISDNLRIGNITPLESVENGDGSISLEVGGNASVGRLKVGDVDQTAPYYDLTLSGNTNIGMGGTCTLSVTNIETQGYGCPGGMYVSKIDLSGGSVSEVTCKAFSIGDFNIPNGDGTNCYDQPSPTVAISASEIQCIPIDQYAVTSVVSYGVPPFIYDWEEQIPGVTSWGDYYPTLSPSQSQFTFTLPSGLNSQQVRLRVTDSEGVVTPWSNVLTLSEC